jgi:hypothetical protein
MPRRHGRLLKSDVGALVRAEMRAVEIMRVLEEPPDQEEHYGSGNDRGGDDAAGTHAPVLNSGTVVVFVLVIAIEIEDAVLAFVHRRISKREY